MQPGSNVPILETERLRLRGHRIEDLENCASMWADPEVTRYIGGRTFSEEEVWARTLRYAGHWAWFGFGYWLVEERSSGRFVGEVGLADYKRDIQPPLKGFPEIGWALATAMSGQGYATEAVGAAIEWFQKRRGHTRTVCLIAPDNAASIRVATKCGYRKQYLTTYKGSPTIIFAREDSEGKIPCPL